MLSTLNYDIISLQGEKIKLKIKGTEKNSIAQKLDLAEGDRIKLINGQTINDYIDFQYETANNFLNLLIEKKDGQLWEVDINRDFNETLGIIPDGIIYDQLKQCTNDCVFCFVRQQPEAMRKALLLKDDDYRFSFLQGSFISLTNLGEEEMERIINLNLTPLNISVHTTNPELRVTMMRNPSAGQIMDKLRHLAENGISFNAQIVLCPGINDQKELDRTIADLDHFYPRVLSLGIVPVGLTRYREGLFQLNSFNRLMAEGVLTQLQTWQNRFKKRGKNYLYAADEFYLMADQKVPATEHYNGFPQIENGIGLTRILWDDFIRLADKLPVKSDQNIAIVTGKLGALALQPIAKRLNQINGLMVKVLPISNSFFGESVTVTGLLTGFDIIRGLKKVEDLPEYILIPGIIFNQAGYMLDNLKYQDLQRNFPNNKFIICHTIDEALEVISNG